MKNINLFLIIIIIKCLSCTFALAHINKPLGEFNVSKIQIKDNNQSLIRLSSNHYTIFENNNNLEIQIERLSNQDGEILVDYQVLDGTATFGEDYSLVSGQIMFASSETLKTISVPIIDNSGAEIFEYMTLSLTSIIGNASLITPFEAVITILDDEQIWEYQSPEYPNASINDLWHAPDGNVWAVCSKGLVLVYDKNSQIGARQIQTHVSYDLNAIWGTNNNNIYVAGDNGLILYYDGSHFLRMPTPTDRDLFAIWGTDTGYLVAGGASHTIIQRSSGSSEWIQIEEGNSDDSYIYAIWGTGEHHVFAVGGNSDLSVNSNGIIDHYNGQEWYTIFKQSNTTFTDIWGMSDLLIRVCGANEKNKGVIAFYNGFEWTTKEINSDPINRIWGTDKNFLIATVKPSSDSNPTVGLLNNVSWIPFSDSTLEKITAISGNSIFDITLAGESGSIYRFDGQSLIHKIAPLKESLNAVWGSDDRHLFAVGNNGAIYQTDGFYWSAVSNIPNIQFNDIFGLSDQEVYAVGEHGAILLFDGYTWQKMTSPTSNDLYGIWGNAPDNLFVVGQSGIILKYSGNEWIEMFSPTSNNLYDISSTAQHIFAVGASGVILQFKDAKWQYMRESASGQEDLLSIWGDPNSSKAFAVGNSGAAFEYQDPLWKDISPFDYQYLQLNCVLGFTSDLIIACGTGGELLIFNGSIWTGIQLNTSAQLNALWSESDTTMTCVGSDGTILRYAAPLTLQSTNPLSEGEFTSANIQINPEYPLLSPLYINLQANPANEVNLPSQLKIPANKNSLNFSFQIFDDNISDGGQWLNIYASAPGHQRTIHEILVMDTDDGQLSMQIPTEISESYSLPFQKGILTLNAPSPQTIDVWMHTDSPEQLSVPEKISIPAGYTSVGFSIAAIDDLWLDGSQFVNIIAMVPGWAESVSQTIQVMDNEDKYLSINGPKILREEKNSEIVEVWISLSAIPDTGFIINMEVDKPTELSVPERITVLDGQHMIPVDMVVVDDQELDGDQDVLISISAPGWQSSGYTLTIIDNESPVVIEYLLTVKILPAESGMIYVNSMLCSEQCQYTFSKGESVTLEAHPMAGYNFEIWAKDLIALKSETSIDMTSNKNIAAVFTKNRLPETPFAIYPRNGDVISDSTVKLIGGTFNDPDNDNHYRTYWKIRVVDQPYACSEYKSMFCYQSESTSLTSYVLTDLISGYKYAWMFGYQDPFTEEISWSDENYFIIGKLEKDDTLTLQKGESVLDYKMISFVHWFPESIGGKVFGANLENGYNPAITRIGTYATLYGDYVEYAPDLWVAPGNSYWVLSRKDIPMPVIGVPVTTRYPVEIKLNFGKDGWNMIACPNKASYDWKKLQIICYDENGNSIDMEGQSLSSEKLYFLYELSSTNKWISPELWIWESGKYKQTSYLDPYKGYWVKVYQSNLYLRFIPEAQISTSHLRSKSYERIDIDSPPQPMNGFDDGVNGIGSGCFISVTAGEVW